jgi:hypothetical protein
MRIPDRVLASVCFLHADPLCENDSVLGTGFFIRVGGSPEGGGRPETATYLVTARHIPFNGADRTQKAPRQVWARVLNVGDASVRRLRINNAWLVAEESDGMTVDVAVAPVAENPEVDVAAITDGAFVTQDVIDRYIIGHGDPLSIVGLFSPRQGSLTPLPIVRSGIIAAEPSEGIERNGRYYRVYLAELRSWGGLSGSPVFVDLGSNRHPDGAINYQGRLLLLGVLSGHFGLERLSPVADPLLAGYKPDELNMGIAMITPWADVLRIIPKDASAPIRATWRPLQPDDADPK